MIVRLLRVAVFLAACATILWLSLAPSADLPQVSLWDKFEHGFAYLVLSVLGAMAFPGHLWRMAGGLFAFGVGIEIGQAFMGLGRQGDPADALANTLGIGLGLLVTLAIGELIKVKSPARGE